MKTKKLEKMLSVYEDVDKIKPGMYIVAKLSLNLNSTNTIKLFKSATMGESFMILKRTILEIPNLLARNIMNCKDGPKIIAALAGNTTISVIIAPNDNCFNRRKDCLISHFVSLSNIFSSVKCKLYVFPTWGEVMDYLHLQVTHQARVLIATYMKDELPGKTLYKGVEVETKTLPFHIKFKWLRKILRAKKLPDVDMGMYMSWKWEDRERKSDGSRYKRRILHTQKVCDLFYIDFGFSKKKEVDLGEKRI